MHEKKNQWLLTIHQLPNYSICQDTPKSLWKLVTLVLETRDDDNWDDGDFRSWRYEKLREPSGLSPLLLNPLLHDLTIQSLYSITPVTLFYQSSHHIDRHIAKEITHLRGLCPYSITWSYTLFVHKAEAIHNAIRLVKKKFSWYINWAN